MAVIFFVFEILNPTFSMCARSVPCMRCIFKKWLLTYFWDFLIQKCKKRIFVQKGVNLKNIKIWNFSINCTGWTTKKNISKLKYTSWFDHNSNQKWEPFLWNTRYIILLHYNSYNFYLSFYLKFITTVTNKISRDEFKHCLVLT